MTNSLKNILVVGATGGTGFAVVQALLERGHRVTAFSRSASQMELTHDSLLKLDGDVMSAIDVSRAVAGQDAVIVALGIAENPLKVRFWGSTKTPLQVRSEGTKMLIHAMKEHGVDKLVVLSSYGVGETRDELGWFERLFFALVLAPQIADTERQERAVRESGLEWVLAQPVHLSDKDIEELPFTSTNGEVRKMEVARKQVAQVLARAALVDEYIGRSVSISG
ncbi:MAG TPA: epimerase [Myxococcales bacterium]|nr:epimerase [Deltaproteobacteria bacterium]HAA55571.1 epimerase [Myxococcales bacterium]|tara:strand:- start:9390 stop:10058 length:669 start_codon:yes stop_codon:yes gene_type:complete